MLRKLLLIVVMLMTGFVYGQESPIRVAVFDGGHPFDLASFDAMLTEAAAGMEIRRFHLPADRNKLGPELANEFDVVLFYDMDNTPLSDEQKSRIKEMFQSGIGIFALHHHVCSNQKWPEYRECLGGIAVFETNKIINGVEQPLSTFVDGQTLDIKVKPNTFFPEVTDFTIIDEAYGKCYVDPKANILLTCNHSKSTEAVAWSWKYGKSTVLTLLLGHDAQAYNNPAFRTIIKDGILVLGNLGRQNSGLNGTLQK